MGRTRPGFITLFALVSLTTACATATRHDASAPVTSSTVTVVAGVALIDPTRAARVVADAVAIDPENAAAITASAVTAAPEHARAITRAARAAQPSRAAEIDAAAKIALRQRFTLAAKGIPDPTEVERLVHRSTPDAIR